MIDYTIKGTKLPLLPFGINCNTVEEVRYKIDDRPFKLKSVNYFVSYGTQIVNNEIYVLADNKDYKSTNYFMFKLEDLNKLTNNNMQEKVNIKDLDKYAKDNGASYTVVKINSQEEHNKLKSYYNRMLRYSRDVYYLVSHENSGSSLRNAYTDEDLYIIIDFKDIDFTERGIIGYKAPTSLYGDTVKLGDIYIRCFNKYFYEPKNIEDKDSLILPKEIVETWEPVYKEEFTYKVGDYLYCIKDFINDLGENRFKKDKVYKSENPQCITNESDNKHHQMDYNLDAGLINSKHGHLSNYFRHATPEEIAKVQEERIVMAEGFELIIKDNKIIHEKDNTDITNYVKSIYNWWKNKCDVGCLHFNGFDFTIKPEEMIISKTGCQSNKGVTLKQWLDLCDKIK